MDTSTRASRIAAIGLVLVFCFMGTALADGVDWAIGLGPSIRLVSDVTWPLDFELDDGAGIKAYWVGAGPITWPGIRIAIGASALGAGVTHYGSIGGWPVRGYYLEGLTPILRTFSEEHHLSLSIGARIATSTVASQYTWWALQSGPTRKWWMLPFAGLEADLFAIPWLRISMAAVVTIPRDLIPDEITLRLAVYAYPVSSRLFGREDD